MGKSDKSGKALAKNGVELNPFGQYRSPAAAWANLERRGDAIVLGQRSNDTATEMRHDYDLLYWSVRQLNQWVEQVRENGGQPTLEDAKRAFRKTILVGDETRVPYLTDRELQEQIAHHETPSTFAERIVTKRWGFRDTAGKTYLRRKPSSKPAKG